jgi:uncharacterized protein YbcI
VAGAALTGFTIVLATTREEADMADAQGTPSDRSDQSPSAQISNRMVRLVREYTGRGPTRVRTIIQGDVVVCVMKDTLTKGERALVARGQDEEVLRLRRTYQATMGDDASAAVEQVTGRRVASFMSDNATSPDVAAEIFLLEPAAARANENALSSSEPLELGKARVRAA